MLGLLLEAYTIICSFIFVLVFSYFLFLRNRDLPPGPFKFPIVGNLWWVLYHRARGERTTTYIQEAWKKYGKVVHITFFNANIIFLNETDTILEVFVKRSDEFSDRPYWIANDVRKDRGVIFENGLIWKALRRFTLVTLKGKDCRTF